MANKTLISQRTPYVVLLTLNGFSHNSNKPSTISLFWNVRNLNLNCSVSNSVARTVSRSIDAALFPTALFYNGPASGEQTIEIRHRGVRAYRDKAYLRVQIRGRLKPLILGYTKILTAIRMRIHVRSRSLTTYGYSHARLGACRIAWLS